jgi:hypothetical protein
MTRGIWYGATREARAFGKVAKPLVCIMTTPSMPPIQAPLTMPTASSSRVAQKVVKDRSSCRLLISGERTLSGT